nr:T9SS type A sorting domain-containing protein [Mucilaginibacter sp. SP1R1]
MVICIIAIQSKSWAATTFDWNGTGTSWTSPGSWTVGSTVQTVNYPGSSTSRTDDIVQFGVNTTTAYTNQPTLTLTANQTLTIASIIFGSKQYSTSNPGTTLTVNGATGTLVVSGDIVQNVNNTNGTGTTINNFINGTATVKCTNIQVGQTGVSYNSNSFLFSHVANLRVTGNVKIFISSLATNGSGFRLEDGNMYLDGQIVITNPLGIALGSNLGYFTVNQTYNSSSPKSNPSLYLSNTNAIATIPAPYGSVNFDGNRQGGTLGGRSTIHYTGLNPTIYTSSFNGFGAGGGSYNAGPTYDNLVIEGTGTAVIGTAGATNASTLVIDSTLITTSNVRFDTYNTATTLGISGSTAAKWTNTATITGGPGVITVYGNLSNTTTAGIINQSSGAITVAGNATSTGVINGGSGALTINGNLFNNIYISGTTSTPGVITQTNGSITVGGDLSNQGTINLGSGNTDLNGSLSNTGTFKMSSGPLTVAKDYTNTAPGTFTASTGTITFDGTAAQSLTDATATGTVFNNVTFSNGSTSLVKTMNPGSHFYVSPTYTLNVNLSAVLKVGSGSTVSTAATAPLTLISNVTGDASIGNLTAGTIAGKLNVQRFVKGDPRRYMLLSSPVSDTTYASSSTIRAYTLNQLRDSTYMTGIASTGGGFDASPTTGNNPSVFMYDENSPVTQNVNSYLNNEYKSFNTTSEGVPMGNALLFYFRGNKRTTLNPFVRPFPKATDATLNFFGFVYKGAAGTTNVPFNVSVINFTNFASPPTFYIAGGTGMSTGSLSYSTNVSASATKKGLNLIGNPYASVIDLHSVYATNTTVKFYYILVKDATTGTNSFSTRYALYDASNGTNGTPDPGASRFALSGQGFFVVAPNNTTAMTFNEGMKAAYASYSPISPVIPVFNVKGKPGTVLTRSAVGQQQINVNQASATAAKATVTDAMPRLRMDLMRDSVILNTTNINFDKTAGSMFKPGEDAPYLASSGQGDFFYSLTADSIGCFANYTTDLEKIKRINLYTDFSNYGLYKLTSPVKQNIDERYTIFLKDKYANDSLDVVHNSEYSFNIDKNPASYATDRFYLSIGIAPGHNYRLLGFSGTKVTAGIQLTWKTDNESNFTRFALEKSTTSGKSFTIVDSLQSTAAGTYTYTDRSPGTGQITYRLLQNLVTGKTDTSKNLTFNYLDIPSPVKFIVYPSTATQNININFGKTYANHVKISVVSSTGSVVKTLVASNTDSVQQDVGNLLRGLYIVQAIDEATGKQIGSAKFFKQ